LHQDARELEGTPGVGDSGTAAEDLFAHRPPSELRVLGAAIGDMGLDTLVGHHLVHEAEAGLPLCVDE
jgi:hypothetical protein